MSVGLDLCNVCYFIYFFAFCFLSRGGDGGGGGGGGGAVMPNSVADDAGS